MTLALDTSAHGAAPALKNSVLNGDCIALMRKLASQSVDLIVTDPPYLVHYRGRDGRTVANDDNDRWLQPAFAEMHRVLKPDTLCVSFYGWSKADRFIAAWRAAGFQLVGHIVFRKSYASSARYLRYEHEQAYLLARGRPAMPVTPIPDVIDFSYTGNRLHPTQKPVEALTPLIRAFSKPGDVVLDPFCGSGSTLVAAHTLRRSYLGMDLDAAHCDIARRRLHAASGGARLR
ncbi:MAG: DNA methyltransferase [Hyphomonadaceae bacterium]